MGIYLYLAFIFGKGVYITHSYLVSKYEFFYNVPHRRFITKVLYKKGCKSTIRYFKVLLHLFEAYTGLEQQESAMKTELSFLWTTCIISI